MHELFIYTVTGRPGQPCTVSLIQAAAEAVDRYCSKTVIA